MSYQGQALVTPVRAVLLLRSSQALVIIVVHLGRDPNIN